MNEINKGKSLKLIQVSMLPLLRKLPALTINMEGQSKRTEKKSVHSTTHRICVPIFLFSESKCSNSFLFSELG